MGARDSDPHVPRLRPPRTHASNARRKVS
jgi:hypothetical protein